MSKKHSGGLPLVCTGLALLFTYFKLNGQLDWSWWLVLSPVWGWLGFATTVILTLGVIAALWRPK